MTTLFDPNEAEHRKLFGMALAASARARLLTIAKHHAYRIAERDGEVHMDLVVASMDAEGHDASLLGNAAGSVFRGMEWTGRMIPSARPSTHARWIRVWKLKGR